MLLTMFCLIGCGGTNKGQLVTYPASGTITFDGNPLENATIVFHPDPPFEATEGKRCPVPAAQSLADGTFVVSTYKNGDGLPEGDYDVSVTCDDTSKPRLNRYGDPIRGEYEALLPERYGNPKTSTLRVSVDKGKNELPEFNLVR